MRAVVMKASLGAAVALVLAAYPAWSQEEAAPSPAAQVMQVVGTTPITISYSSPGVKGRKIWGDLQAFGQNWRAGANAKTTIKIDQKAKINGQAIAKGTYGFYILLKSDTEWELVFSKSAEGNAMEFKPEEDALRVAVKPQDAPMRERLQYGFENFTSEPPFKTDIYMHWEKKKAVLNVEITGGVIPEVSAEGKPAWAVVQAAMQAVQKQDIDAMMASFAEDFKSDQGGGKPEYKEFLIGAKDQGFLEDMTINLENLKVEVKDKKASVQNIEVEGSFGVLTMSYDLEDRDGKWLITYLAQY